MKQSSSAPHSYSRSWELSLKSKAIASSWRLWCTSHHRNHNCHETVECRQSSWGIDEVLFWWFFWFHFGLRLDTVRSFYCRTPATSHKRAAIFAQFLRVSHVHGVVIWTRQGDGKLPEVDPFLTRLVPIQLVKIKQLAKRRQFHLHIQEGLSRWTRLRMISLSTCSTGSRHRDRVLQRLCFWWLGCVGHWADQHWQIWYVVVYRDEDSSMLLFGMWYSRIYYVLYTTYIIIYIHHVIHNIYYHSINDIQYSLQDVVTPLTIVPIHCIWFCCNNVSLRILPCQNSRDTWSRYRCRRKMCIFCFWSSW